MTNTIKALAAATVYLFILGCDQPLQGIQESPFASKANVKAPGDISSSFLIQEDSAPHDHVQPLGTTTQSTEFKAQGQARIGLIKSSLEKEFLLQASGARQVYSLLFNGLKSRVIAFKKHQNKIFMMEASQGHSVSDQLPLSLILAEFQIIEETDQAIYFDFNQGMKKLFVAADWKASDFEGPMYNPDWLSLNASVSYIKTAQITRSNHLEIVQVAQFGDISTNGMPPMVIKYYLSPYQPNPNFKPTTSKGFDKVGFFEVAPRFVEEGKISVRATKFDHTKPIVFAVSHNTPAKYKQAIKDGVLYWNKAFGKEILQVIDAPEGVSAPDVNYNIIQWLHWPTAGFAYADAQMDPRTGEILHAQILMTSSFAFIGEEDARFLLNRLESHQMISPWKGQKEFGLAGMTKPSMCQFELGPSLAHSLRSLLQSNPTDAQIQKASKDFIREIVAHEIGHTLGLRHNFAGSLGSNYPLKDRRSIMKSYMETGKTPAGIIPTSSVMDYHMFEEGVLAGDLMVSSDKALPYDEKAIQTLYDQKSFRSEEVPAFCTDSHMGVFVDCMVFDAGASMVEYANWHTQSNLNSAHLRVLQNYIFSKISAFFDQNSLPVEKVGFDAGTFARKSFWGRYLLAASLTEEGKQLRPHRAFHFKSDLTRKKIRTEELSFLTNEFDKFGGLKTVLGPIDKNWASQSYQKFLVALEANKKGVGYNNSSYEFSPLELAKIKAGAKALYERLPLAYKEAELETLIGRIDGLPLYSKPLSDHALSYELAELLEDVAREIAFSHIPGEAYAKNVEIVKFIMQPDPDNPGSMKKIEVRKKVDVILPKFKYPYKLRLKAAKAIGQSKGEAIDWMIYEKARLKEEFTGLTKMALSGYDINGLAVEKMDRKITRWILENRKIFGALDGGSFMIGGISLPNMLIQGRQKLQEHRW